ncbi:M1 family metallopeptidase [bacterium]|nr:M1 family metallopeptidase [candidate division CSSED10-310 bacterium]
MITQVRCFEPIDTRRNRLNRMNRVGWIVLIVLTGIAGLQPRVFAEPEPPDPESILQWIDAKAAYLSALYDGSVDVRGVRDYDAQHYTLHLEPDFNMQTLTGSVVMDAVSEADGLQVITLDMGNRIDADLVLCGGQPVLFVHEGDLLEITLDRPYHAGEGFSVSVIYHGTPPSWTFNFSLHADTDVFATMAEPEGGRQWWPSNDVPWDKATVTLRATVPDWMVIAANGLLTGDTDHGDGTHTVQWDTQYLTATYLVAAAGTDYETIMYEYRTADGRQSMPVPVYVYPELLADSETAFEDTVAMIEFYADRFGEYPFLNEKYGQVLVPIGGGMEHQTITHINAQYIRPGSKPNSLIAHELAHMWWGDYITMSEWPHIWLNESFATYSDALYHEHVYGAEYLKSLMRSYAAREYTGSIYDPVYLFDSIVYTKGAFVLHMLRRIVGDEVFWSILQAYYQDQRFAYANASTEQFMEICETVSGQELTWFFHQWIFGIERPTIQVGWEYAPALPGPGFTTSVRLDQIQDDLPLFRSLLDIDVVTPSGSTREQVWFDSASRTLSVTTVDPPLDVVPDPDVWNLAWYETDPAQFQFTTGDKLPAAEFGVPYSTFLAMTGGTPPFIWEIIDGALPWGIMLNSASGELAGFPLEKGKFTVTVQARDSRAFPMTARRTFTLKAVNPLAEAAVRCDQSEYGPGETMTVTLDVTGNAENPVKSTLYIVLEVEGVFLFLDASASVYPTFTSTPSSIDWVIPPEYTVSATLMMIPLPNSLPALTGTWWTFLMDRSTGAAAGPVVQAPFEFMAN